MTCTLTPAYGRDYKSQAAIIADLKAGKDFVFNCFGHADDGRYVNLEQLQPERGSRMVRVRYARLTKVAGFTIYHDGEVIA